MALQTDYRDIQPAAVAGAPATILAAKFISRNVEGAAPIGFGVAVSQGATDKGVVPGGTEFVGITALDRSATGTVAIPDSFAPGTSARIQVDGDIWVVAAVVVAAGDPVTFTAAGALSNTGGTAIPNARWDTSTTAAGQLAVVRFG